jgi:anti-sigma factor RsiW
MDPNLPEPDVTDEEAAALLAFLDGHAPPDEAAAIERRLAADPALAAALDRRRFVATAISSAVADSAAPHDLRLRVDAMATEPPHARVRKRRRWAPFLAFAGTAAAVAVALVIAGSGSGLTVDDAVAAAVRPPVAAAMLDPAQPNLLLDAVDQVRFPNFAKKFGWKVVGTRTDEIHGRQTRTVFYEKGGDRIAYTVIAGDALDKPDGKDSTIDGVDLRALQVGSRNVVTWERLGHTCVLSSDTVDTQTLLTLAAWKGQGAVKF